MVEKKEVTNGINLHYKLNKITSKKIHIFTCILRLGFANTVTDYRLFFMINTEKIVYYQLFNNVN